MQTEIEKGERDWIESEVTELTLANSGAWMDDQSRSRMAIVYSVYHERTLSPERWWALLGDTWAQCDNIGRFEHWLKPLFRKCRRLRMHMMTQAERAIYDTLPDTLTVYRGCLENTRRGMSWTLDKEVAKKFPNASYRFEVKKPTFVYRMRVPKSECVYLDDRGEQEIVLATYRTMQVEV